MDELVASAIEGQVGHLRLTRAAKRNALSHALADQFVHAVDAFARAGLRIGVLEADGPIFCAGADLAEVREDPTDPASERVLSALGESPLMWVAVVRHPALGAGVSLAASCPIVIAQDDAWFSLPEHQVGLFPAVVVADLEPHLGARRALAMGLTGYALSAEEARATGLVTEVVPREAMAERVDAWTRILNERTDILDSARSYWHDRLDTDHHRQRHHDLQDLMRRQYP